MSDKVIDTKEVKDEIKKNFKQFFRSKWASVLAERTGYSADYIRFYFRHDIVKPTIAQAALEMIAEAEKKEQEIINQIHKSPLGENGESAK